MRNICHLAFGKPFSMSMLLKILLLVVVLVGAGGVAVLASVDLPAPAQPVERVIPNDRFK